MKRHYISPEEAERRKLRAIKAKDAAERLDTNYEEYKDHLIPYCDLFNLLGMPYPPKKVQNQSVCVSLINDAFDELKLKSRLFVVVGEGAKLYSRGDEIIELVKQRKRKEFNAIKRTNDLVLARLEAHPTGKWSKFLKRQIKVQSIIAETQASYLELDEVFESKEISQMTL